MIKFFRNIRKKLLLEGKFFNYLKYAVGEIVLVVIGILIALQINNWNDQRKVNVQEIKLLKEMIQNLDANIKTLEEMNQFQTQHIQGIDRILYHFKNETSSDSLKEYFTTTVHTETLNLSYATFETIKTIGFDIIKNDSIRLAIMDLYEVSFKHQEKTITEVVSPIYHQVINEWRLKNLQNIDRIFNSIEFRNDENFNIIKNFIESKKNWKSDIIKGNNKLIKETIEVKNLIKKYLEDKGQQFNQ